MELPYQCYCSNDGRVRRVGRERLMRRIVVLENSKGIRKTWTAISPAVSALWSGEAAITPDKTLDEERADQHQPGILSAIDWRKREFMC